MIISAASPEKKINRNTKLRATLHETIDHLFVAVLTVTVHFIYFHFLFFSNRLLSALKSICETHSYFITLYYNGFLLLVIAKWASLLVDIDFSRGREVRGRLFGVEIVMTWHLLEICLSYIWRGTISLSFPLS